MRDRASAALLFGSLWGLAEATAGHALHTLRIPGLAGFLMFPLGFFFMSAAYGRDKNLRSVLMTSWVAASVKLVDLLIPGSDVMSVLNPAQAILLQGLASAGLLSVFGAAAFGRLGCLFFGKNVMVSSSRSPLVGSRVVTSVCARGEDPLAGLSGTEPSGTTGGKLRFSPALITGAVAALAWRSAYLALSLLWTALFQARNILQSGNPLFLRFLVLDSLVNGVLIFVLIKASSSFFKKDRAFFKSSRFKLHPAAALVCLAAAIVAEIAL